MANNTTTGKALSSALSAGSKAVSSLQGKQLSSAQKSTLDSMKSTLSGVSSALSGMSAKEKKSGGSGSKFLSTPMTIDSSWLAEAPTVEAPVKPDLSQITAPFVEGATVANDSIQSLSDQFLKDLSPTEVANYQMQKSLIDSLQDSQESAFDNIRDVKKELDMGGTLKQIKEINAQIAAKNASYQEGNLALKNQPIATPIIGKHQRILQEQSAIEIGKLSAQAQALQGYYDLARQTLNDTINMEQMQMQANTTYTQGLLGIVQKIGDDQQKKAAEARAFEKQKELVDYNAFSDARRTAIQNAGNNAQKLAAIANAKSMDDLVLTGVSLADPKEALQLENLRLQNQELQQKINPPQIQLSEIDITNPEQIRNLPVSTLTKAVMSGYGKLKDLTPTDKTAVLSEMYQVGFNPQNYIVRKLNNLADLWSNIPSGSRGILPGSLKIWEKYTSPEVASFESAKTVLTREIARLNDVGMLSDQDVASYESSMPSRKDNSYEVVLNKILGLSTTVAGGNNSKVGQTGTLKDGRKYVVGPDGDTLLDPNTGQELK